MTVSWTQPGTLARLSRVQQSKLRCKGITNILYLQIFGRGKCSFGEKCTICGKKYTPTCDFWAQVGAEKSLVSQTREGLVALVPGVEVKTTLAGGESKTDPITTLI